MEAADDIVPAKGGEVAAKITSNIDYTIECAEEWVSWAEVKSVRYFTFTVAENKSSENREALVKILDPDNIMVQSFVIAQAANEASKPVILNGEKGFSTISDAVAAASGESVITLQAETFIELVAIPEGEKLTIEPAEDAEGVPTLVGGIQVYNRELTVKGITLNGNKELTFDGSKGIRPLAHEGDTYGADYLTFPSGIVVEQGTAKKVVFEGMTINTNADFEGASGTLLYLTPSAENAEGILFKGCTINGGNTRVCQEYGAKVTFDGNTFNDAYYAIRCGGVNGHITITNNYFNIKAKALDIHSSFKNYNYHN